MKDFPRMPLIKARIIAERFMTYLSPYCSKMNVAGSVRRECKDVGDVEIVIIPKDEFSMGLAFPFGYPGLTVNGSRLKRFIYPDSQLQLELYITNIRDWGRILAIRTGSADFAHTQLAMNWNRAGWAGTDEGLRKKSECIHKSTWKIKPEYKANPTLPPVFDTEENFFAFINVKWVPPQERDWHFKKSETSIV